MNPVVRAKRRVLSLGLAGWLLGLVPPVARAAGAVSYQYQDYREAGGRIGVQVQSALVEQDLGPAMSLKFMGVIDAIAGATPNGQPAPAGSDQVVLSRLHDRREAWTGDFFRQFPATRVDLGLANSRESDYVSTGWSVNTLTDFNRKNTTLLAGVAGTDDRVKVFFQAPWAKKQDRDVIVGVGQLLDPRTVLTCNLTLGRAAGYLSDQYKLVQKSVPVAPGVFLPMTFGENRPDHRNRVIATAALNRAFPDLRGALEASYRFYADTYGVVAHTVELRWLQRLGQHLILQPQVRFYQQSAADFYYYQLDATAIVPTFGAPRPQGPFYSSDYRLSDMRSSLAGLKAVLTLTERCQIEVAVDRYLMRGFDGVTPQSAYPRATILTVGTKIAW